MSVRPAGTGDIAGVVAAYEWLFAPPGARPGSWDVQVAGARLIEALSDDRSGVLIAQRGQGLVGFCTLYLDIVSVRFGLRCWLEDLAVHPAQRSTGVGAALLGQAKRWANARGATHLELDSAVTRTDAHRFYERHDPAGRSLCYSWPV
ncbi:MAG: GNAT family N-acetyltransferase [Pseudonocardiales bacterium]|nr:MAG: GNAT family N-acetyltransferase [Pseudonocardiales bacterium]